MITQNHRLFSHAKTCIAICSLFFIILLPANATASSFVWDANDPSENIKGYKIYYSNEQGQYDHENHVDVGNVTSCDIAETFTPHLAAGIEYYFSITAYTCPELTCTAYNTEESEFSANEYSHTILPDPPIESDGDGIPDAAVNPLFTSDIHPNGAAIKGTISYDHNWHLLQHNGNFDNPVVIAGPSSYNDPTAGIIRLHNISANSFEIKFEEGQYLTDQGLGDHAVEESSYLVIEEGIHQMDDGSTWEAGTLTLTKPGSWIKWETIRFASSFPDIPYLFLTVQSTGDDKPIIIRVRNLNESTFQAAIFAEEALSDSHPIEKVGYLAIYAPVPDGELYAESTLSTYRTALTKVNHNFKSVLSRDIFLQEEQSANDETYHTFEQTNALQIGLDYFAQTISCYGWDPIVIRQR